MDMASWHEDRADIIDLMTAYAWAVDEGQCDDLKELFTEDATADIRGLQCTGRQQIIYQLKAAILRFGRLQHVMGNHLVTVDGATAAHRCQMIVQQSSVDSVKGSNYIVGCNSDDRLVRTEDGWRFSRMVITETWAEGVFDITLS